MFGILKWLAGLAVVAIAGVGVGVYFAFFGAGPQVTYVTPDLVPIDLNTAAPSDQPPLQVGHVAQKYMGWAHKILPPDRLNMQQQLALGPPLIVAVPTHALGNPNHPGYRDHYEHAAYSGSHYLVVIGYDQSDTYIL